MQLNDLTGKQFGRLMVLKQAGHDAHKKIQWECSCTCGKKVIVNGASLLKSVTKSCGCLKKEMDILTHTMHGQRGSRTGKNYTKEYSAWKNMRTRCLFATGEDYHYYGGRGITICPEWDSFEQFFKDMGPKPSALHSLDRKENDLGYSKDNCRWATGSEQAQNRRMPWKKV